MGADGLGLFRNRIVHEQGDLCCLRLEESADSGLRLCDLTGGWPPTSHNATPRLVDGSCLETQQIQQLLPDILFIQHFLHA